MMAIASISVVPNAVSRRGYGQGAHGKHRPRPRQRQNVIAFVLSNPPVHLGLAVDFVPIREFLAGLARRLRRPDGIAYFVAQRYVPVRAIAAGTTADTLKITRQGTDDAKFAVWKCVARGA